jgi:hypothetical protein
MVEHHRCADYREERRAPPTRYSTRIGRHQELTPLAAYRGGRGDEAEYLDDFSENAYPTMGSPLAVAKYLMALRPHVARAIEVRQSWIKELGLLFEDARQGNAQQVTTRAGRLGRDHVGMFRDIRASVDRGNPPEGCTEVQRSVVAWIEGMVKASEALIEVGNTGQLSGMQVAQRHVTDARHSARRFNAEYNRLVTEIKVAVRTARRR